MPQLIRLILVFFPWFTIVFLPKKSFYKYLPVSLLGSVLVAGMCYLAVPFKWWTVEGGWRNKILNDASFILGPFITGTLWVFHLTFGNFKRYFIVNLILDGVFSYPLNYLFQKLKLYRLVNFKPFYIQLFFTSYALILYIFQLILNRLKRSF